MSESCTIFSSSQSYAQILQTLRELSAPIKLIDGEDSQWRSVQTQSGTSELTFNSLTRVTPGDRFSKIILGAHNFARNISQSHETNRQRVLAGITQAQLLVGVVATPKFNEAEHHLDYVFGVAKSIDGLIFNGSAFLDSDGNILLGNNE